MPVRLDDNVLKALLSAEIASARDHDGAELSARRAEALEYYRGEMPDVPAREGRSSVVSRDTADVIGWVLPGIMRIFAASGRMAEYEPVGIDDEAFARQASDYCNHIFWKDNDGYRLLWNATHDSLLHGNSIVKHWWDESEETSVHHLSGLSADDVAVISAEPGVEVLESETGDDGGFSVRLARRAPAGRVKMECIAPEDFLIDRQARTLDEARFCCHRSEVTRSDLLAMGFDRALVDDLPAHEGDNWSEEELARDPHGQGLGESHGDRATDRIALYECYLKADADGDGIAETLRAFYAGDEGAGVLLEREVWEDDVPFSDIPCEPVPHRWDARSLFDETRDIARIKTVLLRQGLDNLYASNLPQQEMEEGSVINPDALVNPKFGQLIIRKKGTAPLVPHAVPFVADKVFDALSYMDQVIERRTGVSRATMALDPEALQNQTATAVQSQHDAAVSQIELIARNMAELGWRRVFRQVLKLVVAHQDEPRMIRVAGRPVSVDPRPWNASMDVTVNTGLGSGSRDRDMAMLNQILGHQVMLADRLAGGGFADKVLDMAPLIRDTLVRLAESAGLRNPDSYYPQVDEATVAEMKQRIAQGGQAPDPAADKARGELALKRAEMQADAALEREKLAADMALKRAQIEAELALKREQLTAELALKRELGLAGVRMNGSAGAVHTGGEPG